MHRESKPVSGRIGEIRCWAICHSTEDEKKVELAMRTLVGDGIGFEYSSPETHFGQPMTMISCRVSGKRAFLNIIRRLPLEQIDILKDQLEERLDDDSTLQIRFDKQFAYEGSLYLSSLIERDSRKRRDTIDLSVHFTTYPSRRENAVKFATKLIEECETEEQG